MCLVDQRLTIYLDKKCMRYRDKDRDRIKVRQM